MRLRNHRIIGSGLFALLLSAAATMLAVSPAPAQNEAPISLRHTFTKGDRLVYSIEMEGAGDIEIEGRTSSGQPGQFTTVIKDLIELNVTDIENNGNAVIEGRILDWEMKFNDSVIAGKNAPSGLDAPITERMKKPFTMKVSRQGEMLEFNGDLFDKDLFPFKAASDQMSWTASLPANPVKFGDTWAEDLPEIFHAIIENKKPQVHFSLVGFETIKGVECAVIEVRMDESDITGDESDFSVPGFSGMNTKISSFTQGMNGKIYFAHEAGVLIGFEFSMNQSGVLEVSYAPESKPTKMKLNLKIDGIVNLE